MMETRCGDIDATIAIKYGEGGIESILNTESGLKGISGESDMRIILEKIDNGTQREKEVCSLAFDMFCYRYFHIFILNISCILFF
jgi:acetate kinase